MSGTQKISRLSNPTRLLLIVQCSLLLSCLWIQQINAMQLKTDIEYAKVNEHSLLLDLYLPDNIDNPPLIVWIHGGAWSFGTKEDIHVQSITDHGFAIASINFRNSPEAQFPAQIHDIKASIRYLRAHAKELGVNADNIAIWGYSSGGHLAALTGTTNNHAEFEGSLGLHLDISSTVQAIVDYSGPANLLTILNQSTTHGVSVRLPALTELFGKEPSDPDIQEQLTLASPVHQVTADDVPLLIMHGVQDNQVPINQSLELQDAYIKQGLPVEVNWLVEAEHTSGEYFESPYIEQVADFLERAFQ